MVALLNSEKYYPIPRVVRSGRTVKFMGDFYYSDMMARGVYPSSTIFVWWNYEFQNVVNLFSADGEFIGHAFKVEYRQ